MKELYEFHFLDTTFYFQYAAKAAPELFPVCNHRLYGVIKKLAGIEMLY